jgi:hypothetical protein
MGDLQRFLPFGRTRAGGDRAAAGRAGLAGTAGGSRRRGGRATAGPAARQREALRRRQFERLMGRLRADARIIADHFGLRYKALLIERPTARSHYGVCYQDGTIKIRLNHAVYQRPLRYSSLVNTVCHELAHLRHFDHGEGFKRFYGEILEWARARRLYRPAGPRPQQASLGLGAARAGAGTGEQRDRAFEGPRDCRVDAGEARRFLGMIRSRLEASGAAQGRDVREDRGDGRAEEGAC